MGTRNLALNTYRTFADGRLGLRIFREAPNPQQRVIWFPFGGGSSHLFSGVAAALPDTWSVWAVDSPGHFRTAGEPLTDIHELCELYLSFLGEDFLRGAWLVGHSLGALVAARLASALEERNRDIAGCIACASCPPNKIGTDRFLSRMMPEQLRARWDAMLPHNYKLRDSYALFEVLAPVIRADILAFESCAGMDIKLSRTPLLAVAGEMDQMVPADKVQAWMDYAASAEYVTIEGGHLFVLSHDRILAAHIESFVKKQTHLPPAEIVSNRHDSSKLHRLSIHALPTASGDHVQLPELTSSCSATATSAGLARAITEAKAELVELLLEYGVILFRGFGVVTAEMVSEVMAACGDVAMDYTGGNSPRLALGNGVYTSTEYPADQEISPHAELCYQSKWPARLYFACAQPAVSGGATPLVDLRKVLSRLQPRVVDQFLERGLLYIRRLHAGQGLGRSWSSTFDTNDREAVEEMLQNRGAAFEWQSDGTLLLKHNGPVVHCHPTTGDKVWFNQAEQWHPSVLPSFIREAVGSDFPHDVRFADNTPISTADVCHIREVLWAEAGQFRWEEGDLLMVDNERMAHGRRSFQGPRRVLVSMGVAAGMQSTAAAGASARVAAVTPPISGDTLPSEPSYAINVGNTK